MLWRPLLESCHVFKDAKMRHVLPYINDFTTYSKNFKRHLVHLENVQYRIKTAGLKIKPSKCFFGQLIIAFLGHEISAQGVQPSPEKVKAVKEFPVPSSLRAVKSFLGLTGYYRRHIKDHANTMPIRSLAG